MEPSKFERLARSTSRSQKDLETMRHNAIARNEVDLAKIATDVLDERFPGWRDSGTKRSGATPTAVKIHNTERKFSTAKEAFVWLMDNLVQLFPEPFEELDWRTEFLIKGTRRLYLAPDPRSLFFGSPHLADDHNNYQKLSNGWFLNVNLNNDEKFKVIARMAALAGLEFGADWSWTIIGSHPSEDLQNLIKRMRDDA
jgi:hypothetical protein